MSDDSIVHTKSGDNIQLPLRPDIPPADVIQQISSNAKGGGGMSEKVCDSNCIHAGQNTIALSYFKPNQLLRINIYSPRNYPSFEFLTEIVVQTDNNGEFELYIDRDPKFFIFIVLDRRGNVLSDHDGFIVKDFMEALPDCPGQLTSRLAVGMRAQVTHNNGVPLQLHSEPNTNPDSYLINFDEDTELKITMGPQCNEGMIWWGILAFTEEDGGMPIIGWVAEGNQDSWFIEPVK